MPAKSGAQGALLEIRPVTGLWERQQFVALPARLYADDPGYAALPQPLQHELLLPSRNPWFEHGTAQLFLALRHGRVVGRISAQVDYEHLRCHKDQTGFFGFFECEDDPEAAHGLLEAASQWCRARGMRAVRGPFSFSINEECGLLVEGFETPNYVMMPHGRPYYERLVREAGFEGVQDLYAWRYRREEELSEQVLAIADEVARYPGLRVRPLDMDNLERDIRVIMDIFNEAWARNWGFVPLTPREVQKVADDFRLIADPEMCLIAEIDGVPAAMAVALPNINEAFREASHRPWPLNWAQAAWRLKVRRPRSFRQILLGVKKEFRGSVLGGLSLHLYVTIHRKGYERGYREAEASWTLSSNERINMGMSFMGAERYKTYRIFEKPLV